MESQPVRFGHRLEVGWALKRWDSSSRLSANRSFAAESTAPTCGAHKACAWTARDVATSGYGNTALYGQYCGQPHCSVGYSVTRPTLDRER